MHPLAEYIRRSGISQKDLAGRAGLTQSMLSQALSGRSRLGLDSARRVYEATGGKVPLKALLYWPDIPIPEIVERRVARSRARKRAS